VPLPGPGGRAWGAKRATPPLFLGGESERTPTTGPCREAADPQRALSPGDMASCSLSDDGAV
jgi:hypothetical protein